MADVFKTQLREQQRRKEMELETRAREKLELARVISTLSTDRYLHYLRIDIYSIYEKIFIISTDIYLLYLRLDICFIRC